MAVTNNVTRMLDSKKITYTAHELPNQKLGALEAAEHIGVDPSIVYKTIVAVRPAGGKPLLALVSGHTQVDLKALAKSVGEKKIKLTTQNEAEKLTGLQTGGISPLALLQRGFQVVLDSSAKNHSTIIISAGQRGLNIQLSPDDLVHLTNALMADIGRPI